jgi:hypothetical protein
MKLIKKYLEPINYEIRPFAMNDVIMSQVMSQVSRPVLNQIHDKVVNQQHHDSSDRVWTQLWGLDNGII